MADLNKEELLKLTPKERIKKLKEIEEAKKKELEEAEKLLKQTEVEIREIEEKKAHSHEEAEAHHKEETTLEDAVEAESHQRAHEEHEEHTEYKSHFDYAVDIYNRVKDYSGREAPLSMEEKARVESLYETFTDVVKQSFQDEEQVNQIASSMKRMVKELLGEYHTNIRYTSE